MLLGLRAVISPMEGLDFDLTQTNQWGGLNYNTGFSKLWGALIFNTNTGSNEHINKMVDFSISYLIPKQKFALHIYAQEIGKNEAGNLP